MYVMIGIFRYKGIFSLHFGQEDLENIIGKFSGILNDKTLIKLPVINPEIIIISEISKLSQGFTKVKNR